MNDLSNRIRAHIDAIAPALAPDEAVDRGESRPPLVRGASVPEGRRWAMASIAASVAVLAGAGGAALYARGQAGQLDRIGVPGLTSLAVPSSGVGADALPLTTPLNVLVVGVDAVLLDDQSLGEREYRADTIVVVRVDPIAGQLRVLSVPRDLWVTDEDGTSGRISSFARNGRVVDLVSSTLGLDISHYVEVDYAGFQSLVDIAGGVAVPFDVPVRDRHTGFAASIGCAVLSGDRALAYVRSRYLEVLDPNSGEWTPDQRSDVGRMERQRDVIRRVLVTVLTRDYSAIDKARLLTDVLDDITVDRGLDVRGLQAIFDAAAIIGPENFRGFDLAAFTTPSVIDGYEVLVADLPAVRAEAERFQRGEADDAASATTPIAEGRLTNC